MSRGAHICHLCTGKAESELSQSPRQCELWKDILSQNLLVKGTSSIHEGATPMILEPRYWNVTPSHGEVDFL